MDATVFGLRRGDGSTEERPQSRIIVRGILIRDPLKPLDGYPESFRRQHAPPAARGRAQSGRGGGANGGRSRPCLKHGARPTERHAGDPARGGAGDRCEACRTPGRECGTHAADRDESPADAPCGPTSTMKRCLHYGLGGAPSKRTRTPRPGGPRRGGVIRLSRRCACRWGATRSASRSRRPRRRKGWRRSGR